MATAKLKICNPFTGELIDSVAWSRPNEIAQTLHKGQKAALISKNKTAFERSEILTAVARELQNQKDQFAKLIMQEVGKPISMAQIEVARAIAVFQWAAAECLRFTGQQIRIDSTANGRNGLGFTWHHPKGLILGITPFNFPLNLVAHKVAPAIASGNAIIIKPSAFAPLCALALEKIFRKVSKDNLLQVLITDDQQSKQLTQHNEFSMISFTGSDKIGWAIKNQAGKKPVTLELGGNAWCVIAPDVSEAQFKKNLRKILMGSFSYAGQSCVSIQNIAIPRDKRARFRDILVAAIESLPFGDPAKSEVISGPVIHRKAYLRLQSLLKNQKSAIQSKNKILNENSKHKPQNLIAPTLVIEPGFNSIICSEEVFGPLINLHSYSEPESLLTRINESRFGLQTGLFTQDLNLALRWTAELQTGGLQVNEIPTTRYDHQPYGGVKDSGQGREGVRNAMEEMCDLKFVAMGEL